jgi:predicted ATPase
LLLDGFMDFYHPEAQIGALERLHEAAEHAQVGIVTHSPSIVKAASPDWSVTVLEHRSYNRLDAPVDFEVATATGPHAGRICAE